MKPIRLIDVNRPGLQKHLHWIDHCQCIKERKKERNKQEREEGSCENQKLGFSLLQHIECHDYFNDLNRIDLHL